MIKGLSPAEGVVARCFCRWLIRWSFRSFEIRNVIAGPFFLTFIPPYELLAIAPGTSVGTRGSAVVENSAIARPCESPAVTVASFGSRFRALFSSGLGKFRTRSSNRKLWIHLLSNSYIRTTSLLPPLSNH